MSVNKISTNSWSAGMYIRLSQEDSDLNAEKSESNSITSQKNIINQFVFENTDINLYDTYIDDGFTGTDFNRPAFKKMLYDMKNKNINCIIVKDLSRLGRNYIEVGNYIEQVFPLFNIRFIAINDYVDSYLKPTSINTIIIPFKNLINDEYCRDTSIKIKSSLISKRKKGEYVGAFPSYGYIKDKDNKHKLCIDDKAADIVKNIFNWTVYDGIGKIGICNKLNDQGILNPTGHKVIELGYNYNNSSLIGNLYAWTPSTIGNILRNEVYIGNTVQGKRKVKSYKIHKLENVPKEEWIRVENTHKPIISHELFYRAQQIEKVNKRISKKENRISIWAGILKCNDCKKAMNKKTSKNSYGKIYEYYVCSTYRRQSKKICNIHKIRAKFLDEIIRYMIKKYTNLVDINKIVNKIQLNTKETNEFIIEKKRKIKEIEKVSNMKMLLYEDWKNNILTKNEYFEYKDVYENKIQKLKDNIENIEKEEAENKILYEKNSIWLNKIRKDNYIDELSRDIIQEMIKYIFVHENGDLTIEFRFKNPI